MSRSFIKRVVLQPISVVQTDLRRRHPGDFGVVAKIKNLWCFDSIEAV